MNKNRQNDYLGSLTPETRDAVHYGVKGMKWGQRKDVLGVTSLDSGVRGTLADGPTARKDRKAINSSTAKVRKAFLKETWNELGPNGALGKINAKYINDLADGKPGALAAYNKEYAKASTELARKQVPDGFDALVTISPDGRDSYLYVGEKSFLDKHRAELTHADDSELEKIAIKWERDENGLITGLDEDELEHQGIKGMKWGVRKDDSSSSTKGPVSAPKDEAPSARYDRLLTNVKKHGANSLSEEDMQFVIKRGEAIRKIEKLNEKRPDWFSSIAQKALKKAGERRMNNLAEGYAKKYIDDVLF